MARSIDITTIECDKCGAFMEPVWFTEHRGGKTRRAVDYMICPYCLNKECVDDSFDGPWR